LHLPEEEIDDENARVRGRDALILNMKDDTLLVAAIIISIILERYVMEELRVSGRRR
jgi:hypothetical protein